MKYKRVIAVSLFLTFVLAACGQKPNVHIEGQGFGRNQGQGDGTGVPLDGVPGQGGNVPGQGGNVPGQGGNVPGQGGNVPGPGGRSGSGAPILQGPFDAQGITATEVRIGIHAPTSGAAPIEPKAFQVGKDLYWNWLKHNGQKVFGRDVKVFFEDDHYEPSYAVQRCQVMDKTNKVFLLIGAAGTDQINACSKYSAQRGIPYLSAGVQEAGVSTRSTFFAVTMSYAQQMPLLVQYIKKLGTSVDQWSLNGTKVPDGKIKIRFVRPESAGFADAAAAFSTAAKTLGSSYEVQFRTVAKEGSPNDASTLATEFRSDGVDIISPMTAPSFTLLLAGQTGGQQYKPKFMGVGITNGINQGIHRECANQEFEGAMFFSPWPGWADVMQGNFDPDFRKAIPFTPGAAELNQRNNGGDLLESLWGIMKSVHQALLLAGPTPTRSGLISKLRTGSWTTGGFFPDIKFSGGSRFGASQIHPLIGDCDANGSSGQFIEDPAHRGLQRSFS